MSRDELINCLIDYRYEFGVWPSRSQQPHPTALGQMNCHSLGEGGASAL